MMKKKIYIYLSLCIFFVYTYSYTQLHYDYLQKITYLNKDFLQTAEKVASEFIESIDQKVGIYYHLLAYLIDTYDLKNGCILGMAVGKNCDSFIQTTKIKQLYIIDPFMRYNNFSSYPADYTLLLNSMTKLTPIDQLFYNGTLDIMYYQLQQKLSPHQDKILLMRLFSDHAAALFSAEQLDFIFLAANHTHDNTLKNLEYWYAKIKSHGIIAGTHYSQNSLSQTAAKKFFSDKNIHVFHDTTYPLFWWIIKP